MAIPYVGEFRMFAGNFAPAGWMLCDGQLLPISEYETLFNLIGTTYGGDGQSTFALPDLRGRVPIHFGSGFVLAETGGVEQVTLTASQIPAHTHPLLVSGRPSNSPNPGNNFIGISSQVNAFFSDIPTTNMNAAATSATGGNQAHSNMQPFLCIHYIISLYGIFPSPS
ncbi:MAG: tail fiber protein [Bacteroidetes bacterium]|nr:tail fiber protein [Bacteroidota bacterium]